MIEPFDSVTSDAGAFGSSQLVEEYFGVLEIRRIEALSEPAIDRCQQIVGLLPLALLAPQPGEGSRGTSAGLIDDYFYWDGGYNSWAEANRVVILYPQTKAWDRPSDITGFTANPKPRGAGIGGVTAALTITARTGNRCRPFGR